MECDRRLDSNTHLLTGMVQRNQTFRLLYSIAVIGTVYNCI